MKRPQQCLNRSAANAITAAPVSYIQTTTGLFTGLSPSTVLIWWLNIRAHWFGFIPPGKSGSTAKIKKRTYPRFKPSMSRQSFLLVKKTFCNTDPGISFISSTLIYAIYNHFGYAAQTQTSHEFQPKNVIYMNMFDQKKLMYAFSSRTLNCLNATFRNQWRVFRSVPHQNIRIAWGCCANGALKSENTFGAFLL